MHINHLSIREYYHLSNFEIDFKKPISVFIGENGSGKSTVLEAIISIFRNLFYTESLPIPFAYIINYEIAGNEIEISTVNGIYEIKINNSKKDISEIQQISRTWIYKKIPEKLEGILPTNILMYYSGQSNRIVKHFSKMEEDYQDALKDGYDMGLKPLFLFHPMHYKIILLGLVASRLDGIKSFLSESFSIEGLDSFEIHLRRPDWSTSSKAKPENFWNAQKIVLDYLTTLKTYANDEIRASSDIVALRFFSQSKLDELINLPFIGYESKLIQILDSLFTAGFIEDIVINCVMSNGEIIAFQNLSEGEQQLIAIKGMTELLRGEETLYLLDEPDNYLHPSWQENLLEDLSNYAAKTHFFVTTHSPQLLTNASPDYSELFILKNGKLQEDIPNYFGKDINSILYNLMNTGYRNDAVKKNLDKLFKAIALADIPNSESLYNKIVEILGDDDPKMVAAKSEIEFLKLDQNEVDSKK